MYVDIHLMTGKDLVQVTVLCIMEISFMYWVVNSFFSAGSGQEVAKIQDKDAGGPVGIPSLPPVQKKPVVQVRSTTSGSSREQSDDDEAEGEAETTQGMDPADAKRVRRYYSLQFLYK